MDRLKIKLGKDEDSNKKLENKPGKILQNATECAETENKNRRLRGHVGENDKSDIS